MDQIDIQILGILDFAGLFFCVMGILVENAGDLIDRFMFTI